MYIYIYIYIYIYTIKILIKLYNYCVFFFILKDSAVYTVNDILDSQNINIINNHII